MPVVRIESAGDPRLASYRNIPDRELLVRRGIFIAEGRLVVRRLLAAGAPRVQSLLVSDAALASLDDLLDAGRDPRPIYVGSRDLLTEIVGFNVHRGCLACGERPAALPLEAVLTSSDLSAEARSAKVDRAPLILLEEVGNPDNIGGIFRSAQALGARAIVLDPRCSDPLYRKAIRVSMGSSLEVPFVKVAEWLPSLEAIKSAGWRLIGLTPAPNAAALTHVLTARWGLPVAFLLGHEGSGLSEQARTHLDAEARIPMTPGVDSLNVATAAAIALYEAGRARDLGI
ncbi:MAG: RNA methyltransferase [Luteitalea sp.]|nr:RNA methyltransferase [Luteitalea sp.]